MASNKTRNEIIYYAVGGTVALIGTVALMLFGANSVIEDDIGPLLAGLFLSAYVFRFGLPWKWLYAPFLMSLIVVAMILGAPGLMWFGGYLAGANLGAAWRMAVVKPKVKSKWTVNGHGFDTITKARKEAKASLYILDGERHRSLVVETGTARFEVAGALPSKLVCHRNHDAENDFTWAVLSREEPTQEEPIDVPVLGGIGTFPSQFVNDIAPVEAALSDFLKNPKSQSFGPEWDTSGIAADLRLSH